MKTRFNPITVHLCCNNEHGLPDEHIIAFDFEASPVEPMIRLEFARVKKNWDPVGIDYEFGKAIWHRRPRSKRKRIRRKWARKWRNYRLAKPHEKPYPVFFSRVGPPHPRFVGALRIGKTLFPIFGHRTHVASWCWDTVNMHASHAARLLNVLRKSKLFHCVEGYTSLYEQWHTGRTFHAKDLR